MNKQIEEMALAICEREACEKCTHFIDATKCAAVASAEKLYAAGYRKPTQPVIRVSDGNGFEFEYGTVLVSQRNVIKSEDKEITRGIRMGFVKKVHVPSGISYWEVQIVYKDENGKLHCDCLSLDEWRITVKHQGNMQIGM